jgi:hypothetical protein
MPNRMGMLIQERLEAIRRRIGRIADRVAKGTYTPPRKLAPRTTPPRRPPWKPSELPINRGWLASLLAGQANSGSAQYRGGLDGVLRTPEFHALIEAAPGAMERPVRSLCWMLGLAPPDIQKRPRKPRQPRPPPEPPEPAAPEDMTGSEILQSPSAPDHLRAKWAKPPGSLSNRLYRKRPAPRARGSPKTA